MSDFLSSAVSTVGSLIGSTALKLGDVNFDGMEIPETIAFGGTQSLSVKRLIGGKTVIERMGATEIAKTWHGRFQGANAMSRARQLDRMMKEGTQVELVFGGMKFNAVISSFVANFERTYQIPYTITCEVIYDPDADDTSDNPLDKSLDDLVGADTLDALGVGDLIGDVSLNSALSTVSSTLSTVGALTGSTALGKISGFVSSAQGITNGIASGSMSVLQGVTLGASTIGGSIGGVASKLSGIASAANVAAHSTVVTNLLGRIAKNID